MSLGDAGMHTDLDESLAVDNTIASDISTTKGRKKTTKAKPAAKGRKRGKKEESVEPSVLDQRQADPAVEEEPHIEPEFELEPEVEPELVAKPSKPTRGRKTKRNDESTLEDPSVMEIDPPVQTVKKGRAKAKKVEKVETPPRVSEDASQLRSELDNAASFASALQSPPPRSKRGVKRTSEGVERLQESGESIVDEVPAKPKRTTRTAKGNPAKKAPKDAQEDNEAGLAPVDMSVQEQQEPKPKRTRNTKKAQKEAEPELTAPEVETETNVAPAIDEESVPESNPQVALDEEVEQEDVEVEDVDIQEQRSVIEEIQVEEVVEYEAEIVQQPELDVPAEEESAEDEDDPAVFETPHSIATSHLPTPAEEEFEPTPTPQKPRHSSPQHVPSSVIPSSLRQQTPRAALEAAVDSQTTSPQSSDAENRPPSSSSIRLPQSTIKKSKPDASLPRSERKQNEPTLKDPIELFRSPVKTTQIPIAPGTPTHTRSPSKLQMSPSKRLGTLKSSVAWEPVDLETIFFSSPQRDVGGLALEERLAMAGGLLSKEEMGMTVEEWVRWRAEQGEGKLRGECERLVGLFEKAGGEAMDVLVGIETSS